MKKKSKKRKRRLAVMLKNREKTKQKAVVAISTIIQAAKELAAAEELLSKTLPQETNQNGKSRSGPKAKGGSSTNSSPKAVEEIEKSRGV